MPAPVFAAAGPNDLPFKSLPGDGRRLPQRHYLGPADEVCPHCGAKMWRQESTSKQNGARVFSMCCSKGKVILPHLDPPPEPLWSLLNPPEDSTRAHLVNSRHVRKHLRFYNNALAMASSTLSIDPLLVRSRGPCQLRVNGDIYHRMSNSLVPAPGEPPGFAQMYVINILEDVDEEARLNVRVN